MALPVSSRTARRTPLPPSPCDPPAKAVGGPRPRFGEDSRCGDTPQANPVTYPFTSYAGDVTFTEPTLGNRVVDFNTEGMIHVGLLPELIEDARRDGVTDEDLEPLFHSAEAYIRMWERAEERAAALRSRLASQN